MLYEEEQFTCRYYDGPNVPSPKIPNIQVTFKQLKKKINVTHKKSSQSERITV